MTADSRRSKLEFNKLQKRLRRQVGQAIVDYQMIGDGADSMATNAVSMGLLADGSIARSFVRAFGYTNARVFSSTRSGSCSGRAV